MSETTARYIVVRYMPNVFKREFANIGVLLASPTSGYFDFMFLSDTTRLSSFFKEFDKEVFEWSVESFKSEIERIKREVWSTTKDERRALIEQISLPREAIITLSNVVVTKADDLDEELRRLYEFYVA